MAQVCRPMCVAAAAFVVTQAPVFAAGHASGDGEAKLEQFAALASGRSAFKPLKCEDLGPAGSPAFRSCFLVDVNDCFYVQTQAEDRDPSIYVFDAHFKPACPADDIAHAEATFLDVFLSCGPDMKAKAVADFLAKPVDLSAPGADEVYSNYVNEHDAYPGYQLKDACPAMAGVNVHDVIDGFSHHGIALYDLSTSSQKYPPKPKAN
jgi:hypothetical protein